MDNFHIDVTAEGELSMKMAMTLAFAGKGQNTKVEAYVIDPESGLVFLWSKGQTGNGVVPLPFKLDAAGAADFAVRWLDEQDYGAQPDHDGNNSRGWRLHCNGWGRVSGYDYSVCAVKPAWAMHGK